MFSFFEELYRSNASWYTDHPLAKMSDDELAALIQQYNLEMTVAELRQQITTPSVTMTCALCGQPQTHLMNCKGCGGDAWGSEFLFAYGDEAPAELRQVILNALQGAPFDENQARHGANSAYQFGGCMVCAECWHHTLPTQTYTICPLYIFYERATGNSRVPAFALPLLYSGPKDPEARKQAIRAELERIQAYWLDTWNTVTDADRRSQVAEWRGRLLLAAFGKAESAVKDSEPETEQDLYHSGPPTTICDRCSTEIEQDEANDGSEFGYGTLCNECYATVSFDAQDREG